MLAYFPVPYEDELLYSVIARYAVHTGQLENKQAISMDIFGKHTAVSIPDLPSHLSIFTSRVNQVWNVDADEVIKHYTLAPIYFPFMPPKKTLKVIDSMLSEQGGSIHTRCGIAASSVQRPEYFRYCPDCINEQKTMLGEPLWLREHQITGVNHCYKHSCVLLSSSLHLHPKQKHLFQAAASIEMNLSSERVELTIIQKQLLVRFQELLKLPRLSGFTEYQWTTFYQNIAIKLGLTRGNRADQHKIREKLLSDWSQTESKNYLPDNEDNNWLISMFRKHRKAFHPLRHLMVWCSLLPEKSNEEIFKLISGLPKTETTKANVVVSNVVDRSLLNEKRAAWIKLLTENQDIGIKKIRAAEIGGGLYAWLYRNDKEWLTLNKPKTVEKVKKRYIPDYPSWDLANISLLNEMLISYQNQHDRKRLSQHFFIKKLPRSNSVEKHLDDLPETMNWFIQHAESIEQYQLFRLNKAAKDLQSQFKPIQKWRLLRIAGIRSVSVTPTLDELITELTLHGPK
jgi:hypothetical protein